MGSSDVCLDDLVVSLRADLAASRAECERLREYKGKYDAEVDAAAYKRGLDDAAKAVCVLCSLDDDCDFIHLEGVGWCHVKWYRDGTSQEPCKASAIHALKEQG